ncbi:unnamed protein product [Heterobilharzia americana]|nr:unnamed protein product [Heterobilharzia americana]
MSNFASFTFSCVLKSWRIPGRVSLIVARYGNRSWKPDDAVSLTFPPRTDVFRESGVSGCLEVVECRRSNKPQNPGGPVEGESGPLNPGKFDHYTKEQIIGGGGGSSGSGHDPFVKCRECGGPLKSIEPTTSYVSRFMKCEACQQLYSVVDESVAKSLENVEENRTSLLPIPKEIHSYLDRHVIGQEKAKRILAVQVYAHYNRIQHNLSLVTSESGLFSSACSGTSTSTTPSDAKHSRNSSSTPRGGPSHPRSQTSPGDAYTSYLHVSSMDCRDDLMQPSVTHNSHEERGKYRRGSRIITDDSNETIKLEKSNIIMLGPTGSGKTLLAQTLARCLDVPFAICDCTTLTQAGYVGEDIESVIGKLLQDANFSVERAQQGIIFLDEVDKISSRSGNFHSIRDVGGEGVQQGMLKLLEGSIVNVPDGKNSRKVRGETIQVDTTNILFVASGAFSGLDKIIARRKHKKSVGFMDLKTFETRTYDKSTSYFECSASEENAERDSLLQGVEARDLIEYGIIPEFVGRFPIITVLHSLDENMLVRILTEPRNALVKQFQFLFGIDGCELEVTPGALKAIARSALSHRTGARGLRAIMESLLLQARYDVPGSDISTVILTESAVLGHCPPEYCRSTSSASSSAS